MNTKTEEKSSIQPPVNFLEEMGTFNFVSKYARYNELMSRRETWEECVNRVLKMHLTKYKDLPPDDIEKIKWAFGLVKDKKVVPSMRSLQFGGKAILNKHLKIYNCCMRQIDSIRAFSEVMYALLCGCGVGVGITKKYINRLPDLVDESDKTGSVIAYTIQDSIEGWSDSFEALLSCYFRNTAFSGRKLIFDYSKIRSEGSPIKTGGGKAPGYKGLKRTHQKIKQLLDDIIETRHQKRLKSIDVYDIIMHESDAVLSGGVRRSALISLCDKDDIEMQSAKAYFKVNKHTKFYYDEDTKKWYGKITLENKKKYEVEISDYEYQEDVCKKMQINWFHIEPQRARCNNSVLLLRKDLKREDLVDLIKHTRDFGEPGIFLTDDIRALINPCFHRDTRIATDKGLKRIIDLYDEDKRFNAVIDNRIGKGNIFNKDSKAVSVTKASQVVLTQKNADLFEVVTEHGNRLLVTNNHTFIIPNKGRVQLKDIKIGEKILLQPEKGKFGSIGTYNDGLLLGSVTGDGTFTPNRLNATSASMSIWEDDFDVLDDFISRLNKVTKNISHPAANKIKKWNNIFEGFNNKKGKIVGSSQLFKHFRDNLNITNPVSIKDRIPECVWQGTEDMVRGYIHGMIFTDGSVNLKCANKGSVSTLNVEISQSNQFLLEDIQILLQNFGIVSRLYKLYDSHDMAMPDGKGGLKTYPCKAGFRLSINRPNSIKLLKTIGLYGRKQKLLEDLLNIRGYDCNKPERYITSIKSIKFSHKDDVFCFTQPKTNSTIANGLSVGQCGEIQTIPETATGECGMQNCNLTTINGAKIISLDNLLEVTEAAAIIGTLQAGYTDFKYLNIAAKHVTEEEALLGVSITGIMDNPDILLNPDNQQKGAKKAVEINKIWAKKIGINQAARVTCIKPDGNTSTTLGTAPGIHPQHARKFFRRIQCNKQETPFKFLKEHNPQMCEESIWSGNKTDEVVTFPITISDKAVIKKDLTALQHLEIIKKTQQNWVIPGTTEANKKPITHNISCTIIVKDNEWEEVIDYVYKNKEYFTAISFLPYKGDKIYKQAPLEAVITEEDEKKFNELTSKYKVINYKKMYEDGDNTKLMEEAGCSSGQCEI